MCYKVIFLFRSMTENSGIRETTAVTFALEPGTGVCLLNTDNQTYIRLIVE